MPQRKSPAVLLDRRTLLFAAELAEEYDKCVLCGEPRTDTPKHRLHPRVLTVQRASQVQIGIVLRGLAATANDLKGAPRRIAKA